MASSFGPVPETVAPERGGHRLGVGARPRGGTGRAGAESTAAGGRVPGDKITVSAGVPRPVTQMGM